jgi:hypothetical protein
MTKYKSFYIATAVAKASHTVIVKSNTTCRSCSGYGDLGGGIDLDRCTCCDGDGHFPAFAIVYNDKTSKRSQKRLHRKILNSL